MAALPVILTLALSAFGATVYRYLDASGQEHFVNDPALAPPEARSRLQPMNLRGAPVTDILDAPKGDPAPASGVASAPGALSPSPSPVPPPKPWHNTWVWAALVSAAALLAFAVLAASVAERHARISWALSVGRYVAFLLLAATVLAASYELRDDPSMQRYSPWAALKRFQQSKLQAMEHDATPP
jgi:hypothetical protein